MTTISFFPGSTGVLGFRLDDLSGGRSEVYPDYDAALRARDRLGDATLPGVDGGEIHILPVTEDEGHDVPEMSIPRDTALRLLDILGTDQVPGHAAPGTVAARLAAARVVCPPLRQVIVWSAARGRDVCWG